MFNNQATQLLITLEEDDKQTLSSILQSASHWTNHFNLITGNDGPFPTVTICFDGINALTHFCASGIIAGIDLDVVSLFALDDLIVEVKAIEIYNNGQVVDPRTIAPMGEKFIELAQAYCRVSGGMNTRSRTPRAIRRDRTSGFMDLSDIGSRLNHNVLGGRFMSKRFGDSRPTFERSVRQRHRTPDYDVTITVGDSDAYLTINSEGAELLERVVTEGGYVFKFQHPDLRHLPEQQINHALHSAGLSTAWIDRESNIISIVVTSDDPIPELDKKEFDIHIHSESDSHPVIVLEDKDGDIYPHMGEVCDHGFRYQSDLLRGLTYANIEQLSEAAEASGHEVSYNNVDGSIVLIAIANNVETNEEVIPELEIKDDQILLGGVPAQVLEIGDRQFEIIFDQDLPMNKHDYAATLRTLLLGRRSIGFNSSWNMDHANVLVVRLEVGDKAKSIKTMRAAVEASKVN